MACRREGKSRLGAISHTGPFPLLKMFACVSSRSKRISHARLSLFCPATCASSGYPSHQQNLCHAKSLWFAVTFLFVRKVTALLRLRFHLWQRDSHGSSSQREGVSHKVCPFPLYPNGYKDAQKDLACYQYVSQKDHVRGDIWGGHFSSGSAGAKVSSSYFLYLCKEAICTPEGKRKAKRRKFDAEGAVLSLCAFGIKEKFTFYGGPLWINWSV